MTEKVAKEMYPLYFDCPFFWYQLAFSQSIKEDEFLGPLRIIFDKFEMKGEDYSYIGFIPICTNSSIMERAITLGLPSYLKIVSHLSVIIPLFHRIGFLSIEENNEEEINKIIFLILQNLEQLIKELENNQFVHDLFKRDCLKICVGYLNSIEEITDNKEVKENVNNIRNMIGI